VAYTPIGSPMPTRWFQRRWRPGGRRRLRHWCPWPRPRQRPIPYPANRSWPRSCWRNVIWFGPKIFLVPYQQFNARLPRSGQTAERVFVGQIMARKAFGQIGHFRS